MSRTLLYSAIIYKYKILQTKNASNIRPPYYPYFYLLKKGKIIEEWGGNSKKQMELIIEKNLA